MKRTPLRKVGRIGLANIEANKRLKELFWNVRHCEIKLQGCLDGLFLQFCHRHPRDWYKGNVELLSSYRQVVIGCTACHEQIDNDAKLKDKIFSKLRPPELADIFNKKSIIYI